MNYIAKIVFCIEVLNVDRKMQFEEKLITIQATDLRSAYMRAVADARLSEIEFINANQHRIRWKLLGITHICPMANTNESTELYSEIKEEYTESERYAIKCRIEAMGLKFASLEA